MTPLRQHTVPANGINHHVAEQGKGPLVLLLHGFPEGWRSWRQQLPALAAAGYRVVAPDARGYGGTDAPAATAAYSTRQHVADVIGLIDALGERQAFVIGHDWGAVTAWNAALLHPERLRGVAALSIPLPARAPKLPTALLRERFRGQFLYILYFQEPGVAEAELEADPQRSLRRMFHAASGEAEVPGAGFVSQTARDSLLAGMPEPGEMPDWLTQEDLATAAAEFQRSGFRGPLNRYRNIDRDWEELGATAGVKIGLPAAFIAGAKDLSILDHPKAVDDMRRELLDLRIVQILPDAGHWIQQERPQDVNKTLLTWLRSIG